VKKYNIDFSIVPVWIPDGQGGFKTVVQNSLVDMTKYPKPSPFVAKE
jgi:hypothetical protein